MDAGQADIFISYSHNDESFAVKLRDTLQSELAALNVSVWMDTRLRRGTYWRDDVDRALEAVTLVIVIVSPNSMRSAYVTYEWSYSWFKLGKEPYLLYFRRCNNTSGMFGRLRDFHLPLQDCFDGDGTSNKLNDRVREIKEIFATLPRLKGALLRLNGDLNENEQAKAAHELGNAPYYLRWAACNYLLQGVEHQLSGRGNGVTAKAIAEALNMVGDARAIPALWRLYREARGYPPAKSSIMLASDKLSVQ